MSRSQEDIKQDIKEARADLKRYASFTHYKKECINNGKIHLKLLQESLKECLKC